MYVHDMFTYINSTCVYMNRYRYKFDVYNITLVVYICIYRQFSRCSKTLNHQNGTLMLVSPIG